MSPQNASPLPPDLLEALQQEREAYQSVPLHSCDSRAREEGLIRFNPSPAAEQDWVGGQVLAFKERQYAWGGEVVHVDPESGDVFVYPGGDASPNKSLDSDSWIYKPFDFSEAISLASQAINGNLDGLHQALAWVQGEGPPAPPPVTPGSPITRVWRQPWGLLWGPPGTGKTETVAQEIASSVVSSPANRILAVATTNKAVDELVLRVCRKLNASGHLMLDGRCAVFRGGVGIGKDVIREFPAVIHDATCLALKRKLEELEVALRDAEARRLPQARLAELKASIKSLRDQLSDETLLAVQKGSTPLIALTVHRALRLCAELAGQSHFDKVVLDEAGMISRGAAALVLPLGRTGLAAGDPKQIGPVSRSREGASRAVRTWLRKSPLSHLENARTQGSLPHVHFLKLQHRMHPHISKVVSSFAYDSTLEDGDGPRRLASEASVIPGMPRDRAIWVILDKSAKSPRLVCHDRPKIGRGYVRRYSAELAIALATPLIHAGKRVLAVAPYRAQAGLLRTLGAEAELPPRLFTASTIHRQQGTEYDAVILDTVAGGRPFQSGDLCSMLNVAASRSREQLFALASLAEAQGTIPGEFLSHLARYRVAAGDPLRLEKAPENSKTTARPFRVVGSLGEEVDALRLLRPIFSDEQTRLFERSIGEGHFLVRGVAGSGKTFVLARWVARFALEHPKAMVLVSFFNKALAPLVERLIRDAIKQMDPGAVLECRKRLTISHVDTLKNEPLESYDAVFVDEAQDMGPERLTHLFALARGFTNDKGKVYRNFFLFMDDSQNVYGKKPIDEFKAFLGEPLSFSGRARVLREAHRSTRQILDLAFNVVLDPQNLHKAPNPGMREFMKTNELVQEGLLRRPDENRDGLYHVEYTERSGVTPLVRTFPTTEAEHKALGSELKRLFDSEGLHPGDVLIVSPMQPIAIAKSLNLSGIRAEAFGGYGGVDASNFPPAGVDFVRVTTVFSGKGHEGAIVFFCDVDQLDGIDTILDDLKREPDLQKRERAKRSLFYVGATRALVRQYIWGKGTSRFVRVAAEYAAKLSAPGPESL